MERINAINGNETVGGFWQPWTTPDSKRPVSGWQSVITYVGNASVVNPRLPQSTPRDGNGHVEHDHAVIDLSKKTLFLAAAKQHENKQDRLFKGQVADFSDVEIISKQVVPVHHQNVFRGAAKCIFHKTPDGAIKRGDIFTPYLDWQHSSIEKMDALKKLLCSGTDSFNNEYILSGFTEALYAGDADKVRYCLTLFPGLQREDILKQAIELATIMGHKDAINVLFEFGQYLLCNNFILAALEQTLRWQRYDLYLLFYKALQTRNGFNNINMNVSIPAGLKHLEPLPNRMLQGDVDLTRYRLFQSLHLFLWKNNGNVSQTAREVNLNRSTLISRFLECGIVYQMYKIKKIFVEVNCVSNTMIAQFPQP